MTSKSCTQSRFLALTYPVFTDIKPRGTSSFQILRELYWKGDTVINKQGTRAYRLVDAFIEERSLKFGEVARNLVLDSVYVDFQGERFGTIKDREKIPEFKGISYIKDLPRFPLSYHPDAANVARRLLERGQKFASLSGQRYMIHRSLVPNPHKGRYGEESSSEERSDSDVDSRVPSNRESAREVLTSTPFHSLMRTGSSLYRQVTELWWMLRLSIVKHRFPL